MNVLYLSYTGLLEPLGRSQVFAYLRELADDHTITVISFEKPADIRKISELRQLESDCATAGVRWCRRVYHQRPRLLMTALDLVIFFFSACLEARRGRAEVVHARSYIACFVAWLLWKLGGPPFIFDMRALWIDEMIAAGRLRPRGWLHNALRRAERTCLRDAAAVVSLTEVAVPHIRELAGATLRREIAVVPTCVDLARFTATPLGSAFPAVIGCIGTVLSGWFRFSWLLAFISASASKWSSARFEIVSLDDPAGIEAGLAPLRPLLDRIHHFGVAFDEVPDAVAHLDVGVMFFEAGVAKLGSCPTRMGEFLAAGRPIVANEGVGDVANVIRQYRVGVVVDSAEPQTMGAACRELEALLADPDLSARCRRTAEELFSLDRGVATYSALYRQIASGAVN